MFSTFVNVIARRGGGLSGCIQVVNNNKRKGNVLNCDRLQGVCLSKLFFFFFLFRSVSDEGCV